MCSVARSTAYPLARDNGLRQNPATSGAQGSFLCSTACPILCVLHMRSSSFVDFSYFYCIDLVRHNGLRRKASRIGRARRFPAHYHMPRALHSSSGYTKWSAASGGSVVWVPWFLSTRAATGCAMWPAASGGRVCYLRLRASRRTVRSACREAARPGGNPCASIPGTGPCRRHPSPRARPTKQ